MDCQSQFVPKNDIGRAPILLARHIGNCNFDFRVRWPDSVEDVLTLTRFEVADLFTNIPRPHALFDVLRNQRARPWGTPQPVGGFALYKEFVCL